MIPNFDHPFSSTCEKDARDIMVPGYVVDWSVVSRVSLQVPKSEEIKVSKGPSNILPWWLRGRDNGNNFSFPVPSPFLKLNDNCVKSFLSGYPIF